MKAIRYIIKATAGFALVFTLLGSGTAIAGDHDHQAMIERLNNRESAGGVAAPDDASTCDCIQRNNEVENDTKQSLHKRLPSSRFNSYNRYFRR